MKKIIALIFLVSAVFPMASFAWPLLEDTPLHTGYIPAGYDDNDRVQLMVEGSFSNTCYRVGPSKTIVDEANKTIFISQKAYHYDGFCLQVIVNYSQTINLGIKNTGEYKVVSYDGGIDLGTLHISKAKNRGPDDHLYAPLTDATIKRTSTGQVTATVNCNFNNRCMRLKDVQVIEDGVNVITILPIAEMVGSDRCKDTGPYNYSRTIAVPKLEGKNGRFMLNARSLNGQAITKLFDL